MNTLGRGAENSKSHFGGCPGALGKVASKGMFRAPLGSSWAGGHKLTPEDGFLQLLGARPGWRQKIKAFWVETRLEAVNYGHAGSRPSWRL